MENLNAKTILITGASSGIGNETAKALSKFNVRLLLVGRNEEKLKAILNEKNNACEVHIFKIDLSKISDINHLIGQIKVLKFEPDIIIHCAGTFYHAPISETSSDMIDTSYNVNFKAPFIITRELLENIKQQKGQIIFINSTVSNSPKANSTAYSTFKSALKTFAEVLHQEVYPFGVRVTNIYPGRVATPMQEEVCKLEGKPYKPENYINPVTISKTIIDILTLPYNVEISELTIRPTT